MGSARLKTRRRTQVSKAPPARRLRSGISSRNTAESAQRPDLDYRRLYDFAPVIWMVLDSAGIILEISRGGSQVLQVPARTLIGMPLTMLADADSRPLVLEHVRRCRQGDGDGVETVETVITLRPRKSGVRTVRLYSQHSQLRDRLVFPTVALDISEEHEMNQARLRAERQRDLAEGERRMARAAEAAKDRLIATVSHELRNPLSPALMAATMLVSWPGLPERVRSIAGVIRRNIELEARLIDDLLDVARATRGQLDLRMQTVDVHDILRHAITVCQAAATAKQIHVVEEFGARFYHATGDPGRLEQVFWNLINNAIKFSNRAGQIIVRTFSDEANVLRITVRDFGAGMDAETQEKLFSPFEQPRVPAGGQPGLGLGLTIARSIVEQHGGQIWATSEGAGRGSIFDVELMALAEPSANTSQAPPDHQQSPVQPPLEARGRVLIVEDHEDTGLMLYSCLRQRGYDVSLAKTVADALPRLDEDWDAVLSDIGLGDGSGLDIARRLQAAGRRPAHLVALSGYGTEGDIKASREAGFDKHLVKPVDLEELLTILG